MFDDEMENLFSQFDRQERRIKSRIRKVDQIYMQHAMRKYEHEILTFVKTLLEGTGVILSKEPNDEA